MVTGGSQGAKQAAETLSLDYGIPMTINWAESPAKHKRHAIEPRGLGKRVRSARRRGLYVRPPRAQKSYRLRTTTSLLRCRERGGLNLCVLVFKFQSKTSARRDRLGRSNSRGFEQTCFVYDVNFHQWYKWNKATGVTLMTTRFPILAPRSPIIGSKAFPSKAQDAMKKLFELNEQAQAREVT